VVPLIVTGNLTIDGKLQISVPTSAVNSKLLVMSYNNIPADRFSAINATTSDTNTPLCVTPDYTNSGLYVILSGCNLVSDDNSDSISAWFTTMHIIYVTVPGGVFVLTMVIALTVCAVKRQKDNAELKRFSNTAAVGRSTTTE